MKKKFFFEHIDSPGIAGKFPREYSQVREFIWKILTRTNIIRILNYLNKLLVFLINQKR